MRQYSLSEAERQISNVLYFQQDALHRIQIPDQSEMDINISESEQLLRTLGVDPFCEDTTAAVAVVPEKQIVVVPSWRELCTVAEQTTGGNRTLEALFTDEELETNALAIRMLNEEYNVLHRLDALDVTISAAAGLLGAAVDLLLVGIPQAGPNGVTAGPLSNFIREQFNKAFPPEEMEKLANSKGSKVPYDAQDNRNTTVYVEGMSAYYHRLLSLGHDPLLGFIFGVMDILTGRMTTIDKGGKIVSQVMPNYEDRRESNLFAAIAKQFLHLKSDVTTSMGLPVPLMALFNLCQFGSIGDEEQTIAELVQGMYYEGYDFIHFCSMSIPTMIVEVVTRLGYFLKRIHEGHTVRESIPFSLNRERKPKLATMLFIGHSAAAAVNAGKVLFTKNLMCINYSEWLTFSKLSYRQMKWVLLEKPAARDAYVRGRLDEALNAALEDVDESFAEWSRAYTFVSTISNA